MPRRVMAMLATGLALLAASAAQNAQAVVESGGSTTVGSGGTLSVGAAGASSGGSSTNAIDAFLAKVGAATVDELAANDTLAWASKGLTASDCDIAAEIISANVFGATGLDLSQHPDLSSIVGQPGGP